MGGLLRYLYGPGKREEHTNPHLVAAWDGAGPLSTLEPPVGLDGKGIGGAIGWRSIWARAWQCRPCAWH